MQNAVSKRPTLSIRFNVFSNLATSNKISLKETMQSKSDIVKWLLLQYLLLKYSNVTP